MTRDELARDVANATGLKQEDADKAIVAAIEVIKTNIRKGENVYLRGFGTIMRKLRAPKMARNISKNTPKQLPSRFVPGIKFSKSFVESMPKP